MGRSLRPSELLANGRAVLRGLRAGGETRDGEHLVMKLRSHCVLLSFRDVPAMTLEHSYASSEGSASPYVVVAARHVKRWDARARDARCAGRVARLQTALLALFESLLSLTVCLSPLCSHGPQAAAAVRVPEHKPWRDGLDVPSV